MSDNDEELLPLGGIANRETVLCNQTGKWITHMSDRYGMNNPDSLWNHQSIEIAAVGDACANGWCCEPEEHFVSLIREDYTKTVTLGMSGNGPLLYLGGILEYLPAAQQGESEGGGGKSTPSDRSERCYTKSDVVMSQSC